MSKQLVVSIPYGSQFLLNLEDAEFLKRIQMLKEEDHYVNTPNGREYKYFRTKDTELPRVELVDSTTWLTGPYVPEPEVPAIPITTEMAEDIDLGKEDRDIEP